MLPNVVHADPALTAAATEAARAGVAGTAGDLPPEDRPTTPGPVHAQYADLWRLCRTVMKGTRGLREAPDLILPKWPDEDKKVYEFRVKLVQLFNAYRRTVGAMVGLLLYRDPTLGKKVSARVRKDWENLDGKGNHGAVVIGLGAYDAMQVGPGGWLIDATTPENLPTDRTPTIKDETDAGARAVWRWYRAEDILDAVPVTLPNGTEVWGLVRLREFATLPKGKYGRTTEERVRVLRRLEKPETAKNGRPAQVKYEVRAERKNPQTGKLEDVLVEDGHLTNQVGVPFVDVLLGPKPSPALPAACDPPLEDLLWELVGHTQVAADHRFNLSLAANQQLHISGEEPAKAGVADGEAADEVVAIGPGHVWRTLVGGKAEWFGADAAALDAALKLLAVMEGRMGTLGLNFIAPDRQGAETATAHNRDSDAEEASLDLARRRLTDGIERGLAFHAAYYGEATPAEAGGSIEMPGKRRKVDLPPGLLSDLIKAEAAGQCSLDLLVRVILRTLKNADLLGEDEDMTPEQELRRILAARAAGAGEEEDDETGDKKTGDDPKDPEDPKGAKDPSDAGGRPPVGANGGAGA